MKYCLYALFLALSPAALAKVNLVDQATQEFFESFKKDPKTVVDLKPIKRNALGIQVTNNEYLKDGEKNAGKKEQDAFRLEQAKNRAQSGKGALADINKCVIEYYSKKIELAKNKQSLNKTIKEFCAGRPAPKANDYAGDLVDAGYRLIKNIHTLDQNQYRQASLKEEAQPWSSDYWAIRSGILAKRYKNSVLSSSEEEFPHIDKGWKAVKDYYLKTGALNSTVYMDYMSPAEKYDMLMGDKEFSLANAHLNAGKVYHEKYGEVESWMGICHGWAPAAYMDKRPLHTVYVKAPNNEIITFYPDDIKALSVLKWADGQAVKSLNRPTAATKFVGGRCYKKEDELEKDEKTGIITDPDCYDTNPATWHLVAINQIAVHKRSFVLDITFDYEVWNQPVKSIKVSYFDPRALVPVDSLEKAKMPYGHEEDSFAHLRKQFVDAPDSNGKLERTEVKEIVGILMDVEYMVETDPRGFAEATHKDDAIHKVRYIYDLELDKNGNIIGGAWYQNLHPDFLWSIEENAIAANTLDVILHQRGAGAYKASLTEAPAAIFQKAHKVMASTPGLKMSVLGAVVDGLIEASQTQAE